MARSERSRFLCSSAAQPAHSCQVLHLEKSRTKKSKIMLDAGGAPCVRTSARSVTPPPRMTNLDEPPPPLVRRLSRRDSAGDVTFSIEPDEVSAPWRPEARFDVEPRAKCRKITFVAKASSFAEATPRSSTPFFCIANPEERPPLVRHPSRHDSAGDETFSPAPDDEVLAPWPLHEKSWRPQPVYASLVEHSDFFGSSPWFASDIQWNDFFGPMDFSLEKLQVTSVTKTDRSPYNARDAE
eukprot:TRINITY_DN75108_c0_g1_i1.p1 TRINITY_DN75108_c0_g1~~TRINITY_DN75108_c0_g1_i1.p1  ORF type:complete len:255 (-),score=26.49 TRINITY_DN75108_c0_g1_i1:362-1081(-)